MEERVTKSRTILPQAPISAPDIDRFFPSHRLHLFFSHNHHISAHKQQGVSVSFIAFYQQHAILSLAVYSRVTSNGAELKW